MLYAARLPRGKGGFLPSCFPSTQKATGSSKKIGELPVAFKSRKRLRAYFSREFCNYSATWLSAVLHDQ